MVTQAQIDFFAQLLGEKDFGPDANPVNLSKEFAKLDKRSASAWIDKALTLPKAQDGDQPELVQPAF